MPRTPQSQWGHLFNFAGGGLIHMELFALAMATTQGIKAQDQPTAATWTELYEAPAATTLTNAVILCANLGPDIDLLSIAMSQAGAAQADDQIIYPAVPINPSDCFATIDNIRLAAGGKIYVKSLNGTTVFTLFGDEAT